MDSKDIENGENGPPGEVRSTPNKGNTETEKLPSPAELATPAANPSQDYEALHNETKNKFLEYTLNAESRFILMEKHLSSKGLEAPTKYAF